MTPERPLLMDWVLLAYVLLLALTPTLVLTGLLGPGWLWLVTFFPSSFFLAALALTLLKSLLNLPLRFGLSGPRWTSILFLVALLALYLFTMARHGLTPSPLQGLALPRPASLSEIAMRSIGTPFGLFVFPCGLFALAVLFSGSRLGPKPRPAGQE